MSEPVSGLPLDGVRVVALEQAVSAPFATRQLADMGARVIKVERVPEGDFARYYDTEVRGMASHFVWVNRNKESIALDLQLLSLTRARARCARPTSPPIWSTDRGSFVDALHRIHSRPRFGPGGSWR